MLDLVKNGQVARTFYAIGEASGQVRLIQSRVISPACGAQLWRLTGYHQAVVWVEKSRDAVTVHTEHASAADEFFRIVAALEAKHTPKPAPQKKSRRKPKPLPES